MNPFDELQKVKTLLVDDDELIRDSLSMAFSNKGCYIRTADSAETGLRALREDQYDLIISDYRLPGISGLEFMQMAVPANPRAVKVMITAYRDHFVFSEALRMGIKLFIEKPFTMAKLVTSLARSFQNIQAVKTH